MSFFHTVKKVAFPAVCSLSTFLFGFSHDQWCHVFSEWQKKAQVRTVGQIVVLVPDA